MGSSGVWTRITLVLPGVSDSGLASLIASRVSAAWHGLQVLDRPADERREEWPDHIERYGGLRASGDRLRDLDAWELDTTRRLLHRVPASPFSLGTTFPDRRLD
jgi:hypothetical protein